MLRSISKTGPPPYIIRKITQDDVPQTLDVWREAELQEWTHCLHTWLQVDKDALNIAVTDTGEVIGVCSAVIYNDDMAFLGLYAVRKQFRGLGIGKKLWDASMDHIGARNGILNAVVDKTELYRTKGGFPVLETEWTVIVYETYETVLYDALSDDLPEGVDLQSFQESHLPAIFEYDLDLMSYERELALELNCKEQDSSTLVAFKGSKCVGFGTIKTSCNGLGQVGPMYADSNQVAEVMLRRLIISLPKAQGFTMVTVSSNLAAKEMMNKLGCPVHEECPRMASKKRFQVDTEKVFAHFDLNFSPY